MDSLRASQFAKYFEALHGSKPFPWQERLLAHVASEGSWPEQLAIPTGCGKTAVLDVAVFHLAMQATGARTAPLRIISVVDRRTIVDQTFDRARRIRDGIAAASSGVLAAVRERLGAIGREGQPLTVALLRGGIARDESWARSPDQPSLIVSTVDQVGSRLLFRGYGVSDSMKPVHAGLLANDVLYLLDEVHLSNPFAQTLEEVFGRYSSWCEDGRELPRRAIFVKLSATPRTKSAKQFGLDEEDRCHPLIKRRLDASKPVELLQVKAKAAGNSEGNAAIVDACAARVKDLVKPGRAVAVVVNRVATAREIHAHLEASLSPRVQVRLITGRMRPLDRQDLDESLVPRVRAGRVRSPDDPPIVVVSTQCIEAGADYDFDALVTECASLDALRQRFGRLNRLGEATECGGVIVARSDCAKQTDPIYGEALGATWEYLRTLKKPDFGVEALALPGRAELEKMLPPEKEAPVLLPAHLDFWVQTRPVPEPDPEVSLWLHGPDRGEPEVQFVWRSDLSEQAFQDARTSKHEGALESLLDRIEACPPSSPEALAVPLSAARRWLEGARGREDLADVEGGRVPEEDERPGRASAGRLALRWAGEESRVVRPEEISGGDTLVVPASYGGLAAGNWTPEARDQVVDLGERAHAIARGKAVLRLFSGSAAPPPIPVDESTPEEERDDIRQWLDAAVGAGTGDWRTVLLKHFQRALARGACRIERLPALGGDVGPAFALFGRRPLSASELEELRGRAAETGPVTTEDDSASFSGVEVPLRTHLAGVEQLARDFAQRAQLPADRVTDLAVAGAWHDAGKMDPRFQVMLHGGSRFLAEVAEEPLAKSAMPANDRIARQAAQRASGYPRGARHELASVALMMAGRKLQEGAKDFDLVLHLVASHHGWCRPLAPVVVDPSPVEVAFEKEGEQLAVSSATHLERLDSGVSERFWLLVRRYGWFGLAWMEAILRLADHRRSEIEQRGDENE